METDKSRFKKAGLPPFGSNRPIGMLLAQVISSNEVKYRNYLSTKRFPVVMMSRPVRLLRAFKSVHAICTLLVGLALFVPLKGAHADEVNVSRYSSDQVARGAQTLPIASRLAYRDAIDALKKGDAEQGEKLLLRALELDPMYPDPYFTLTRVKIRQLDVEATVYLMQAFVVAFKSYSTSSLLALNAIAFIPYVLFIICLVVCFAFAVKYLPFAAHSIREILQTNLRAALPGFCAFLLLLIPLTLFPGVITALAYITTVSWMFMYKRERFLILIVIVPFIALGLFGNFLRPLTSIADPNSLTSLIASTNTGASNDELVRDLERAGSDGLQTDKNLALGLAHQKNGQYVNAADYYFRAISLQPENPAGYINLGNVYFLQGQYEKALEGYRKAESIEPMDPICQHALAQAYIKTLLMKESSKSLQLASSLGIEAIKASYAPQALSNARVFPKTFSNRELWRIANIEGKTASHDLVDEIMIPFTRFPKKTSAWILIGALLAGMILSRVVKPSRLTFQCTNCGRLTCERCCNSERTMNLCEECAKTVDGITSEKVADALLRQKRQAVFQSRRKSVRFVTMLLPGVRDISYGRIARGFYLTTLFAFSLVQLYSQGLLIKDPTSLVVGGPLWKLILPIAGIVVAYLMSILGKQRYDFRAYRSQNSRQRMKQQKSEMAGTARVA